MLRVCSDPNNLPFSNEKGEGFENKIAERLASELGATVEYTWWAERRGFFRNTLNGGMCDVVMGVPAHGFDMALATEPLYASTYVFVTKRGARRITSLDDPALRTLTVGVQLIGDDFSNTPPAHALTNRGIVQNVRGYTLYGDYADPNPPARIVDAVAKGDVDVAIVWGPLAGYFAKREPVALDLEPVTPVREGVLPFTFEIALGVRKADVALRDELNAAIERARPDIDRILNDYGVPRVSATAAR